MYKNLTIAIDGYSSCGKSTIAKSLARELGYKYVDTGAMYRAVALYFLRMLGNVHISPLVAGVELTRSDKERIVAALPEIHISFMNTPSGQHTLLNGEDVEAEIRHLMVGNVASQVSTITAVRSYLVAQQQAMGEEGGIVMDGRDIGTVVFPQADIKLFLTATAQVRAERRYKELLAKGEQPEFADVLKDVLERDYRDTHRAVSPLRKADDAIVIDNSDMTPDEQMAKVMQIVRQRLE